MVGVLGARMTLGIPPTELFLSLFQHYYFRILRITNVCPFNLNVGRSARLAQAVTVSSWVVSSCMLRSFVQRP